MLSFIAKVLGIDVESESPIERVIEIHGDYFVLERNRDSAIALTREEARDRVRDLGGDPRIVARHR